MKTHHLVVIILLLSACSKQQVQTSPQFREVILNEFTRYRIPAGQQYCDQSTYTPVNYSELKFTVKFDSSAIYQTTDPLNQNDINKLYGFSDNNGDHHQFSARFGWRWSAHALRLFGYTYNNGLRASKELGNIQIGSNNICSIRVGIGQYYFTLNGTTDSMSRESLSTTAIGYQLYPYFGGDETAPHDINIWIR